MSTAERFEVEPSSPPQGRSTAGKLLFGCGAGCGVLALVCCGGGAILGFIGYRSVKDAVNNDPASVNAMAGELATIEVPAGLEPKFSINFKIPFVNKTVFKAVVYTDGRQGNDTQLLAIGEVPGAAEVDQNRLAQKLIGHSHNKMRAVTRTTSSRRKSRTRWKSKSATSLPSSLSRKVSCATATSR